MLVRVMLSLKRGAPQKRLLNALKRKAGLPHLGEGMLAKHTVIRQLIA